MLREYDAGATCPSAAGAIVPVWRSFPSRRIRGYCGFAVGAARNRSSALAPDQETRVIQRPVGHRRSPPPNQKVSRYAAASRLLPTASLGSFTKAMAARGQAKSPAGVPKGFLRPIASEPVRRFGRGAHRARPRMRNLSLAEIQPVKPSETTSSYIEKPTCLSCEWGSAVTAASKAFRSPTKTTCSTPRVNAV